MEIGCGFAGYPADKGTTRVFGRALLDGATRLQGRCMEIRDEIPAVPRPGTFPPGGTRGGYEHERA